MPAPPPSAGPRPPAPPPGRAAPPWLLAAAVLVSGAAVLVVETLAARLVAPYVGLTLESQTSAIGVALLGIAAGARWGGRLADRVEPRTVLAGALAAGGLLVLAVRPLVHLVGPAVPPGAASAVLLVAVSTLPAVTVLSMTAPAAVKARLRTVDGAGSVVGSMSALGTLGALAGTFLTGFVFVAALPTGGILLVTALACLALGAVAGADRARSLALPAAGAAVVAGGLVVLVDGPCEEETTYYCARVVADPGDEGRDGGRVLVLDDLRHSYVDLDDPAHLEFAYVQRFADVVDSAFPAGEPLDAVHVGGGGFTMPRWLAATRPGSSSVVLELDEGVVELGRRELGVDAIPGLRVRTGDARVSLAALPHDSADLVVGDAFGSLSVPWHLATREFLADVDRVLRPGGVLVLNVIDNAPRAFLAAETRTVDAVLDDVVVLGRPEQLEDDGGGNFVVAAADRPLDRDALAARAGERGEPGSVLGPAAYEDLVEGAPVLTDDRAPVDQLLTPYRPVV
ncbi:fused MFS/spermidine synthase [Vallicoccus soli]|uniref:Methyltransferase domain-containing protein n=1 Tax=Vallicoccus soli TaxID=2339232 RepID=A0A3A3YU95_9ACTN|nr:fused MFS/spermidine synthase [Vallicoccus soli]RJK92636.1 methyltransferase domain-containing protein [Vallicoccus soli]